jgi:hypothetical protein
MKGRAGRLIGAGIQFVQGIRVKLPDDIRLKDVKLCEHWEAM